MISEIRVEQINVSDDQYRLVDIAVATGERVTSGDYLLSYESSKASFEVEAQETGLLYLDPQLAYGVGLKEHKRGFVAYNISQRDFVAKRKNGTSVTIPSYSGLFCKEVGKRKCLPLD